MVHGFRKIVFIVVVVFLPFATYAENVNLNFFVGSEKILTKSVAENNTYSLASIISEAGIGMGTYECRDYTFVGWKEGSPISGDEVYNPSEHTTITPANNVNLYAVFSTDPSNINSYIRITSEDNLEPNSLYLIVCYYVYGDEQQYYVMTPTMGTYDNSGKKYNRLNAERLYPNNGIITLKPEEAADAWTLMGTAGAWKWYNAVDKKWLFLGADDQTMLQEREANATTCVITQANGIWNIKNKNNNIALKYVDDEITEEDDYFITGTTVNDYAIYLYKKESPYTSYPDCSTWTVHLNALDGHITGYSTSTFDLTEEAPGSGVTLPSAELNGAACAGWEFVGWSVDAPINSSNTKPAGLIDAGSYDLLYNGVTLYAVYTKTEYTTYYERISSSSELTSEGTYIITNYGQNKALSTQFIEEAKWPMVNVSTMDGIIRNAPNNTEWKYTVSGSVGHFVDPSNNKLAYNRNQNYWYIPFNSDNYFYLYFYYSSRYYFLSSENENTNSYNQTSNTVPSGNQYKFIFYKKKTGNLTSYTAYPHCAPYTIYLHACGGSVEGEENVARSQATATAPISLPAAKPACDGWTFVGWFVGEEKESFEHVEFTDFKAAGSDYIPDHEETHLYALYRRITDKFTLVSGGVSAIASGDTYIITYYSQDGSGDGKVYDYMLSAEAYTANRYLKAVKWASPENAEGFYIVASDSAVMWTLTRVEGSDNWYVRNLKTGAYLNINNTEGYATAVNTAATTGIKAAASNSYNFYYYYYNNRTYTYTYYNLRGIVESGVGHFGSIAQYTSGGTSAPYNYVYRRVKEYASWPHCDPFTINFDACGGTSDDDGTTKREESLYAGFVLPKAYANADCAKEGWSFAGWSKTPVNDETDVLSFNIYPAGTTFHPTASHTTLYAVYQQKTNQYRRITTTGRLFTGVNYIIATNSATSSRNNKALANLPDRVSNPTAVTAKAVTPDAAWVITNEDPSVEWRLEGTRGEYEWYNADRDVFLNLTEPGKALLNKSTTADNFDVTYVGASYRIRSCISIAHSSGAKYLSINSAGTQFVSDSLNGSVFNSMNLYLYRQLASYHSYPVCLDDIDVIKWAKVDDEFNSVTVESYHLKGAPDVHGSYGTPELQEDGTYLIKFRNSNLLPCTKATVEWDGVTSRLRIPYIVSADANLSDASLLNGTKEDCSECDVYIEPGNTLTVTRTDTIHRIYIPDGATLKVADGTALNVSVFSLLSEGDQASPEVDLSTNGTIVLHNGDMYYDKRIDEERYYWFSLPFDAELKEVSFVNEAANGGVPQYYAGTDGDGVDRAFFIKYYNGALRAEDANGGALATTYWSDVVANRDAAYTLKAGQGYEIGLADQAAKKFAGQDYTHTSRVFRFTMRPGGTWLNQERKNAGSKTTVVTPSMATKEKNAVHAGWNLIGNPYLHTYNTGTVPSDGNIRNGKWAKELNEYGDWTGWYILDESEGVPTNVPYLTLYDPSRPRHQRYSQVLAASHNLRPFEAVFVQVNKGNTLNFGTNMSVTALPAYMRFLQPEEPIRTGIILSGEGNTDRTGFVLSEDYTPDYEIGADLEKVINSYTKKGVTTYSLNLYSLNDEESRLAFNALSPEAAADTVRLGMTLPQEGEYTFAFDDEWYGVKRQYIETLDLIDLSQQTVRDLLHGTYTFTAAEGVLNGRFALVIRLKKQADDATGVEQTPENDEAAVKFIRNDHVYIRRGNEIYNIIGTRVH